MHGLCTLILQLECSYDFYGIAEKLQYSKQKCQSSIMSISEAKSFRKSIVYSTDLVSSVCNCRMNIVSFRCCCKKIFQNYKTETVCSNFRGKVIC